MNITEMTDPGSPFAVVSWYPVTATDNSGSFSVMSNYQSGDSFPIGNTDVVYNATDPSGNLAITAFVVTIKGKNLVAKSMYFISRPSLSKGQFTVCTIFIKPTCAIKIFNQPRDMIV